MNRTTYIVLAVAAAGLAVFWIARRPGDEAVSSSKHTATDEPNTSAAPDASASATAPAVTVARVAPGTITIDGEGADWPETGEIEVGKPSTDGPFADFARILDEERLWRETAFAHDGENLYIMITLAEGVAERYRRTHSTGALGYLKIDTDGDPDTGFKETGPAITVGCDCSIWLPLGFHMKMTKGTSGDLKPAGTVTPLVEYEVQRISAAEPHESTTTIEKSSNEDPGFINFAGKTVEMTVPLEKMGIAPPSTITCCIDSMGFTPETFFTARIE